MGGHLKSLAGFAIGAAAGYGAWSVLVNVHWLVGMVAGIAVFLVVGELALRLLIAGSIHKTPADIDEPRKVETDKATTASGSSGATTRSLVASSKTGTAKVKASASVGHSPAEPVKPKYFRKYPGRDNRHCVYGKVPADQTGELEGPWKVLSRWTENVDVFRMHDEDINYFLCMRDEPNELLFTIARDGAEWLNDSNDPRGYLQNLTVVQYGHVARVAKSDWEVPDLAGRLAEYSSLIESTVRSASGKGPIILSK